MPLESNRKVLMIFPTLKQRKPRQRRGLRHEKTVILSPVPKFRDRDDRIPLFSVSIGAIHVYPEESGELPEKTGNNLGATPELSLHIPSEMG